MLLSTAERDSKGVTQNNVIIRATQFFCGGTRYLPAKMMGLRGGKISALGKSLNFPLLRLLLHKEEKKKKMKEKMKKKEKWKKEE